MATTTTKRGATKKAKPSAKSASASKKSTAKKTTKKPVTKKVTAAKTTSTVNKKVDTKATTTVKKVDVNKRIRIWNWVLAVLAVGQAAALIAMSNKYLYSVTTSFTTKDELSGMPVGAQRTLFDFNILYLLAAALLATAVMHVLLATVYRKKYEMQISNGVNSVRWLGFSATLSLVMLSLAVVVGVTDLSTLLLIVAGCVSTGLLAMVIEAKDKTRKSILTSSILAALAPWIVIVIYLLGVGKYGTDGTADFVYYLAASVVVLVALLDVNMYLNSKKTGRWADYRNTDLAYMLINFVLCSALAWQVYFGLLK